MARCPFCQRGALRLIATSTQGDPPLIAPVYLRQPAFSWSAA
jgi:hypothetical protein